MALSVYRSFRLAAFFEDWIYLLASIVTQGAAVVLLFRAARTASHCRERRNFDFMASAVKAQRPFWMLLALIAAVVSVLLSIIALNVRHHNTGLKQSIEEFLAKQKRKPAPPP